MSLKIDVTIATMNSAATIEQCIENIRKYVPYNQIIVVDGGSEDQTVTIAEKLGANVYFESGSLPKVRYVQATLCNSEWIAVVDSDVFLNEDWWREVSKYLEGSKIAAVSGWLRGSMAESLLPYEQYTKFLARMRTHYDPAISAKDQFARLDTDFPFSNTLIRRILILKSKSDLQSAHAGDDTIVARNAVKWGYKIVKIEKILGAHYHSNPTEHAKMEFYRTGKEVTEDSYPFGLRILLTKLVQLSICWLRFSSYSRKFDSELYAFLLKLYLELVKGVIHGFLT